MAQSTKRAARRSKRSRKPKSQIAAPVPGRPGELPEKRRKAAAAFAGPAEGNKTKAMKKAGYAKTTAEHRAAEVFKDPRVQAEIRRVLDIEDLTDQVVVHRHRRLVDAKSTKFFKDTAIADVEDNQAALGAVALYYELTGRIKRNTEINVVVQHWTEFVLQTIEQYVPENKRQQCLDEVVQRLSEAGLN